MRLNARITAKGKGRLECWRQARTGQPLYRIGGQGVGGGQQGGAGGRGRAGSVKGGRAVHHRGALGRKTARAPLELRAPRPLQEGLLMGALASCLGEGCQLWGGKQEAGLLLLLQQRGLQPRVQHQLLLRLHPHQPRLLQSQQTLLLQPL